MPMGPSRERRAGLLGPCLVATLAHAGLVAVALASPMAFGYGKKMDIFDDVRIYWKYATPVLEGRLPYRDYRVEYPPLAIPVFLAPLLVGTDFSTYKHAFVVEMLLVDFAALWLLARRVEAAEGRRAAIRRLVWYSACFGSLCPLIVARFDLVPMLAGFAAACALESGTTGLGGVLAGLGTLAKLVPGLVMIPWATGRVGIRDRLKGLTALAATVGLGALGWWLLAGSRLIGSLRYHGERGLEIESAYATLYLVVREFGGTWVFSYIDHASMNIAGPGTMDAAALSPLIQGALLLLVARRAHDADPGKGMRLSLAAILAYVIAGKVLSPQYLIWMIPFACGLGGKTGSIVRPWFLACCVLTTAIYPHLFHALSHFEKLPVAVLALRNAGLVGLFVIVMRRDSDGSPFRRAARLEQL